MPLAPQGWSSFGGHLSETRPSLNPGSSREWGVSSQKYIFVRTWRKMSKDIKHNTNTNKLSITEWKSCKIAEEAKEWKYYACTFLMGRKSSQLEKHEDKKN